MLEKITIIAFDLDDTLWPCMPTINYAEQTLYQWLEQNHPRITTAYNEEELVTLRREFSAQDPRYSVDLTLLRYDFLEFLARRHDYDTEQVSQQGFEVFFNARQQVEFYDDVLPCLHRLKERYQLGSISNGNASIEHVGLGHLIEHSVSASDLKVAKPDRLIFDHLAKCFDAPPEQIVYVGDHPVYDVVGPVEAGYQAIWINREGNVWPDHLTPPNYQITDLHQLESLLSGYTS